jgi:hypothetical protein
MHKLTALKFHGVPSLRRQARRNNWGITGRLRDHPQPRGVADTSSRPPNQGLVPNVRSTGSRAAAVFDESGWIVNDATKEQLRQFIDGFLIFVQSIPSPEV